MSQNACTCADPRITVGPCPLHPKPLPCGALPRYFHGGFGGLRRGDLVLPSGETGAPSLADYGANTVCRRDRVYIATIELAAVMYADGSHGGDGDA